MKATQLTDTLTISPQLAPDDFAALAARGVRMVVNNRPDGEEIGQLPAAEATRIAAAHGMAYRHIPVTLAGLSDSDIAQFEQALREADGPVHAHCRTGVRSATLYVLGEVLAGRMTREQAQDYGPAHGLDLKAGLTWLDRRGGGAARP
jgi:uncharacterized protein (TIGR01244 family)